MNLNWQLSGQVAPGGPVLNLSGDAAGRLWLASPAGLFCHTAESWQAIRRGIPFWRINTVLSRGQSLWLAGMPHGILRSTDHGRSWSQCWIDQTEAPVLALAASPDYSRDRVLLAGTDGDGILRTIDGGRHWELSNFGLRDFAILDLALAPSWERYQYAFAVSESGLYQSPNGGRAWRQLDLGLPDLAPTCLTLTPTFAQDRTLFAGTQEGQLFVSNDAGHSWRLAAAGLEPVNALQVTAQGTLLVGAGGEIIRQPAAEAAEAFSREQTCQLPEVVLSLNEIAGTHYAGLTDGLYRSADDGRSWLPASGLAARRFVWYLAAGANAWLAAGPEEGVYLSQDGGQEWQPIWYDLPVLAVAASNNQIAISTPGGLAVSTDAGRSWDSLFQPENPITALVAQGNLLWAGSQTGRLWRIGTSGRSEVEVPFAGQPILGLFARGPVVIAAAWSAETGMVHLWRSADAGQQWQLWFSQASGAIVPQLAFRDETGQDVLVGLGTDIYQRTADGWQRQRLSGQDAPITALWAGPDLIVAALTDHLVCSHDGQNWSACDGASGGQPVVALLPSPEAGSRLLAGTSHGQLLRA